MRYDNELSDDNPQKSCFRKIENKNHDNLNIEINYRFILFIGQNSSTIESDSSFLSSRNFHVKHKKFLTFFYWQIPPITH